MLENDVPEGWHKNLNRINRRTTRRGRAQLAVSSRWCRTRGDREQVQRTPIQRIVCRCGPGQETTSVAEAPVIGSREVTIAEAVVDDFSACGDGHAELVKTLVADDIEIRFGPSGDCTRKIQVVDRIVIAELTVAEIAVNTSVNATASLLTSLNGSASWQWLDCDNGFAVIPGASFQTFSPTSNGSYAVEVTDNGCVDTSACYDFTSIGVEERSAQLSASLTPTMTSGPLRLVLDAPTGLLTISITDVRGHEVMRSQGPAKAEQRLDVSSLGRGVYQLRASTADGSSVLRFIRE